MVGYFRNLTSVIVTGKKGGGEGKKKGEVMVQGEQRWVAQGGYTLITYSMFAPTKSTQFWPKRKKLQAPEEEDMKTGAYIDEGKG